MNVFDEMGEYWSEIADQNQTECQVNFLKKMLSHKGRVLDFACGTGRHLIHLSQEGHTVIGLDISVRLLKIAKSRWHGAELVRADMRFLPFKPQAFSAAVSMDQSFGYLPSDQDDIKSLSEIHGALGKEGVLIVDLFNPERSIKRGSVSGPLKWREYPSFFLQQNRMVTTDGGELHDSWLIRSKSEGPERFFEHISRLYTLNCFQGLLEKAGFRVTSVYGDYEQQDFNADSSRLIFMAASI